MGYILSPLVLKVHAKSSSDKVKLNFPWYKRVAQLLKSSPVHDPTAVANSTTPLDLSVLSKRVVCLSLHNPFSICLMYAQGGSREKEVQGEDGEDGEGAASDDDDGDDDDDEDEDAEEDEDEDV